MPTTPSLSPVFSDYVRAKPKLERYVQAKFPRLCRGHVEDAVSAVGLALVMNPTTFQMLHNLKDPSRLLGLFKRVAWRAARATVRRRAYSAERAFEHEDDVHLGLDAAQPLTLALRRDLEKIVREAATETSPPQTERLAAAVMDQLYGGGTDGEVAERHGVRREYVNRARQQVTRHFVSPPPSGSRPLTSATLA